MREKITSLVFVAMLALFFTLVMVLPKDEQASVQENRPLAEMPEASLENIFWGDFCEDYETFLTDNVGFRSYMVKLGTAFENSRGIQLKETGKLVDLPDGSRLALNDGKIMTIYKQDNASMQQYINALNMYSEKFSGSVNMYSVLVPTQIEFDKSQYRLLADSEKVTIDTVYSSLNNFKTANVYDKLQEHSGEYIYFRTDHHWTQRGAYYGYSALMETKGEQVIPLEDMKEGKLSGFLGYLYNQANIPEYAKYADDIEYFMPGENYLFNAKIKENDQIVSYQSQVYLMPSEGTAPNYGIFMGSDHPFAEVDTNVKNGKTALVIKDSYANALLPFLTSHYEKILVVDPRNFYGTVTELTKEYEIDDIIFINYVSSTALPGFIENIQSIL